jgi:hypothetical protein
MTERRGFVHIASFSAFLVSTLAMMFTGLQWREANLTRKQQLRAYVGIETHEQSNVWTAVIKCKGPSPASHVNASLLSAEIPDDESGPSVESVLQKWTESGEPDGDLGPFIMNSLLLPESSKEIPLEKAKPVNFQAHKVRIFYGKITYQDIFGQSHKTHYCIRLGDLCRSGNDAD